MFDNFAILSNGAYETSKQRSRARETGTRFRKWGLESR